MFVPTNYQTTFAYHQTPPDNLRRRLLLVHIVICFPGYLDMSHDRIC